MEEVFFADDLTYNNILYIGDNAKDCLKIIENFTGCLLRIETYYAGLLYNNSESATINNWLQHQIQYHFEGGVVVFKFRNEEEIPAIIRNECLAACRNLAFEQLFYAS
jgi:hypothetical protein